MSTNPFRKSSSLKGPGGSSAPNISSADPRGTSPGALSLDTRVPSTSQKHVNFASPPAIPISPVSYPPSPESTRQEFLSTFPSPKSPLLQPTDYSLALASDPFAAEPSDGEDDGAIEQALKNAKANNEITALAPTPSKASKEDAVRNTLGRFASAPRRPSNHQSGPGATEQGGTARATMDVDAFKKMLLTGERGSSGQSTLIGPIPVSDSGSSADTASISQQSIFETVPPTHESPRTSDDLDLNEADEQRARFGPSPESRRKPPPPKSRRGKPLRESGSEPGPTAKFDNFINSLSRPASRDVSSETPSLKSPTLDERPTSDRFASSSMPEAQKLEAQKRVPPAPPLARRKSQQAANKPVLTRSSSSRYSVLSDHDAPPSPSSTNATSKAPPPPPTRRSTGTGECRPSLDVGSLPENASLEDVGSRPGLAHTPSYLKRLSQGAAPPPVPPPRRGRGSSRSSIETARPSVATPGMTGELAGSDANLGRKSSEEPRDILADIAALQKEVDAARAGAGQ